MIYEILLNQMQSKLRKQYPLISEYKILYSHAHRELLHYLDGDKIKNTDNAPVFKSTHFAFLLKKILNKYPTMDFCVIKIFFDKDAKNKLELTVFYKDVNSDELVKEIFITI